MPLKITTWNINSVRLRIDLVAKFLKSARPDVLCLQETKCPDDAFPLKRFQRLGYAHAALNGQKGYHGVAVLSRLPFETIEHSRTSAARPTAVICPVVLGERAGLKDPITLHNFYVPAGGDEPDPEINPKFRAQARLPRRDARATALAPGESRTRDPGRRSQRGAARARRLEPQADDQGGFAHADRMREAQPRAQAPATGSTRMRVLTPEPEKLYTWWSYRAMDNWRTADRGRRLDHVWTSDALADRVSKIKIAKDYRGAARPSDHVPVTATVEL